MTMLSNVKMSKSEVISLLRRFDDSSDIPLHKGLDFDSYSQKLSTNARFIVSKFDADIVGFIAYYLNEKGAFVYVPQTVVHKSARHKGVGHAMFSLLYESLPVGIKTIRLEVLKANDAARSFYMREGFSCCGESNDRFQMAKEM